MPWTALIVETTAKYAEALSDSLIEFGALSADIHDAAIGTKSEQPLFEDFNSPPPKIWPTVEITALFDMAVNVPTILQTVAKAIQLPYLPTYRLKHVEEEDWVRLTQAQFDPIHISGRLWVVPSWHQEPDPKAINLILDPGLAFGTGSHPTTQLCLGWLNENLRGGEDIIDYGCGSGILGIAALKLGAGQVLGIDIDPRAVESSRDNAKRNQCDRKKARFYTTNFMASSDQKYSAWADIVIANILANPLIMLAPILANATRDNGRVVLSGILKEQIKEVEYAYRQWFKMRIAKEKEGWVLLIGARR